MKKLLLAFAFCPLIGFAQQQVPNGNFEDWSATPDCQSGDSLDGYTSFDEIAASKGLGCVNNVYASTDAQSGSKAVKMVPFHLETPITMTVPSGFFLGSAPSDVSNGGIPFTDTPSKLKGYYKVTIGGTDELRIGAVLYKDGETIGFGTFSTTSSVNTYTAFEADITYSSETTPDSLVIAVFLGNFDTETADAASVALVDNFSFEYTTTSINKASSSVKMFYTVAGGELKFSESVSEINISDIQGKSQTTYNASTSSIPVSKLNNGMYLVTYKYKDNYYSSKFIVE